MDLKVTIICDGILVHKSVVRIEPDDVGRAIESITEGFRYAAIGIAVVAVGYFIGDEVIERCEVFPHVIIKQIPREHNSKAELSKLASSKSMTNFSNVYLTTLKTPTIKPARAVTMIAPRENWITPFLV